MKITLIDKRHTKRPKTIKLSQGLIAVHVTEEEAVRLIQSLSGQIAKKDPNSEREESITEEGTYFSIFVTNFRKTREQHKEDIAREEWNKKFEDDTRWLKDGVSRKKNQKK